MMTDIQHLNSSTVSILWKKENVFPSPQVVWDIDILGQTFFNFKGIPLYNFIRAVS